MSSALQWLFSNLGLTRRRGLEGRKEVQFPYPSGLFADLDLILGPDQSSLFSPPTSGARSDFSHPQFQNGMMENFNTQEVWLRWLRRNKLMGAIVLGPSSSAKVFDDPAVRFNRTHAHLPPMKSSSCNNDNVVFCVEGEPSNVRLSWNMCRFGKSWG